MKRTLTKGLRLFSSQTSRPNLFVCRTDDRSVLPEKVPQRQFLLKSVYAELATVSHLNDFITGMATQDDAPVNIFFLTSEEPITCDGLINNIVTWPQDKINVEVISYSINKGLDVIIHNQKKIEELQQIENNCSISSSPTI